MREEEIVLPSRHVHCVLHYVSNNNNMYVCSVKLCHVLDGSHFSPPIRSDPLQQQKINSNTASHSLSAYVS